MSLFDYNTYIQTTDEFCANVWNASRKARAPLWVRKMRETYETSSLKDIHDLISRMSPEIGGEFFERVVRPTLAASILSEAGLWAKLGSFKDHKSRKKFLKKAVKVWDDETLTANWEAAVDFFYIEYAMDEIDSKLEEVLQD